MKHVFFAIALISFGQSSFAQSSTGEVLSQNLDRLIFSVTNNIEVAQDKQDRKLCYRLSLTNENLSNVRSSLLNNNNDGVAVDRYKVLLGYSALIQYFCNGDTSAATDTIERSEINTGIKKTQDVTEFSNTLIRLNEVLKDFKSRLPK